MGNADKIVGRRLEGLPHRHAGLPAEVPEADALLDELGDDGGVAVARGDVHRGHPQLGAQVQGDLL